MVLDFIFDDLNNWSKIAYFRLINSSVLFSSRKDSVRTKELSVNL